MIRPKVPFALLLSATTMLMAPVVILLLLFVSLGALGSGAAWFAAIVLALALGGIVRTHLADLARTPAPRGTKMLKMSLLGASWGHLAAKARKRSK